MNTHPSALPYAATIGLDWADKKHDLWIQSADGGKPEHRLLEQSPEAIHEWVARLRQRCQNRPVALAIETSRGAVISALLAYDFIVIYPINPSQLSSYRQAFFTSGAKDDKTDAMLLEEYLRHHHAKLRPLHPDTPLTRKISGLVEARRDLVDQRTRLVNQTHSLVKTYYPLVEVVFKDFTTPMLAQFLLQWPDLASLKKAGAKAIRSFLTKHNCRSDKLLEQRLQAVEKAVALTSDQALIEPAVIKVKALAGQLAVLHESIGQIEAATEKAMALHPEAALFRSFPGAGPVMAPRLLAAFGTDRDRFASAQELQQFYGIAPVKRQSGQSQTIHMRHRCPKFGRQTFHENAGHVVRNPGWAKECYEGQRERKKGHHTAVRCVSFKLTRIYFACWKERRPYDQATYEKALEIHGSPLIARVKKAAAEAAQEKAKKP
ncbi:MAG: IS110 family transposase [Minisyncoccia bacterium]